MSEETPDNTHLENYMRRYVNDRDTLSEQESLAPAEAVSVEQTPDDGHLDDYMRRYVNDRTS